MPEATGRIAILILASSLVHAAALVGLGEPGPVALTGPGSAPRVSVQLVPAGSSHPPDRSGSATDAPAPTGPGGESQAASDHSRTAPADASAAAQASTRPPSGSGEKRATQSGSDGQAPRARERDSTPQRSASSTESLANASAPASESSEGPRQQSTPSAADPRSQPAHAQMRPRPAPSVHGRHGHAPRAQTARRARSAVRRALAEHFHYPSLARRRGWEGRVVLRVRIEPDGRIAGVDVASSSGRSVLDQAARKAVRRIDRLRGIVEALGGHTVELELPVVYRLRAG